MKKIETILGEVSLLDARINRASGYGQYNIAVEIEFERKNKILNVHSTDSQLFDLAYGADNHSEIVLKEAFFTIERSIESYIGSL